MLSLFFDEHQEKLEKVIIALQKLAETTAAKPDPNQKYLDFLNKQIAELTSSYNYNENLLAEMNRDISERYKAGFKAGRERSAPGFSRFKSADREYVRAESITKATGKWRF